MFGVKKTHKHTEKYTDDEELNDMINGMTDDQKEKFAGLCQKEMDKMDPAEVEKKWKAHKEAQK